MERNNNNLSNNNMKDHSLGGGKSNRENYYYYNNNNKAIKSPWEYSSSSSSNPSFADDYMGNGFSWPPRSYICSFCKREFRSAQALGGHMNVHRRDRARLRSVQQQQSPPRDINLNLSPNPNPNFLTTTTTTTTTTPPSTRMLHPSYTTTCTLPSCLVSPSLSSSSFVSPSHLEIKKLSAAADDGGALLRNLSPKGYDSTRTTKAVKSLFGVKEFDGFTQARDCDHVLMMKNADFVGLELGIGLHNDLKEEDVDLELRLGYS